MRLRIHNKFKYFIKTNSNTWKFLINNLVDYPHFPYSFENSNAFEPFPTVYMRPKLLDMNKNGLLPYHKEGIEYYNIVENMVKEWLGIEEDATTDEYAQTFYNEICPEFKGKDNIIDVLSQFIFRVTCYHEIFGVVVQYVNHASMIRVIGCCILYVELCDDWCFDVQLHR